MKEHVLNLNTAKRKYFTLTLMDELETVIHVKTPTLEMFREMQASVSELEGLNDNDPEAEVAIYDLTGRLLSNNTEGLTITGEDLRTKYGVGELDDLLLVYGAFTEFVADIKNAKN